MGAVSVPDLLADLRCEQAIKVTGTMFSKILIANRGEIACRVIKTARRLGIKTVAVYSDADRNARHVAMADEAIHIGASPARESYLVADRIIDAARRTGAEAIHPGYGFLSENAGFADDHVLVERYLTRPRHIEIQVFADGHGNCLYLFERDCSIQRRHQKVIEEAPAPDMDPARREQMGQAAVAAAKAIGYVGAGTVEFIADQDGTFYFMEMNTRLQVEHPVTEMITGQDLVEWQLVVAAGGKMPLTQEQLRIDGHAVEVRLYAEDPVRNFLPSTGTLVHLRLPAENAHVRVDTGVREGDTVTPYYDPMIAKVIVHDRDRRSAMRRMASLMAETEVVGVTTNAALLRALCSHPAFVGGEIDTGFIERHRDELFAKPAPADDRAFAVATLARVAEW